MTKAIWQGVVLAESDNCIEIEGTQYFPPDSVKREFFKDSELHSVCPWKGKASYLDVVIGGKINKDAAWYYPEPSEKAMHIKNFVAFWKGVEVTD